MYICNKNQEIAKAMAIWARAQFTITLYLYRIPTKSIEKMLGEKKYNAERKTKTHLIIWQ